MDVSPNSGGYQVHQTGLDELAMLSEAKNFEVFDQGINITPGSVLERYSYIGKDGIYVTELKSIEDIIGFILENTTVITITKSQVRQIENDLGLNDGGLEKNNTISMVSGIRNRCPSCPNGGNDRFLGAGVGLPNGNSELVIDSIPSIGGDGIRQIKVIIE